MKEIKLGYKKTKVGIIPESWKVITLGEIAEIKSSKRVYQKEYVDEGVPFYRSKEIIELSKGNNPTVELFITREHFENLKENYKVPNAGDLMITSVGSLGNTWICDGREFYYKDGNLTQIVNNNNINTRYISYMFDSEYLKNQYIGQSNGSAQLALTLEKLRKLIVILPTKEEQEKIVEILSSWDLAIEKQEQLIEKKKEFKKGLMQRLLSGEVRLKEFSDEWKTYKINKLVKQITKKNKENKVSLVLSVTNKRGFITQEEQFEKQVASKDLSNYKIVTKGEFAYNPSRINVGSIDLLRTFEEGLLSPMYVIFKCNENILSKYLLYWINTSTFTNQMNKYLSGSVRETLSFDDMGLMKIKLPTIEEQAVIVNVLETADKEIELLEKELEALKLQKKGLMQRLLTGEVRVKV